MTLNNNPETTVVSQYCLPVYVGFIIITRQKRVSYLYRTAQPSTLAAFRPWGSLTGAGRIRLTRCKDTKFLDCARYFFTFCIKSVLTYTLFTLQSYLLNSVSKNNFCVYTQF